MAWFIEGTSDIVSYKIVLAEDYSTSQAQHKVSASEASYIFLHLANTFVIVIFDKPFLQEQLNSTCSVIL
jgi:hypothetical protein